MEAAKLYEQLEKDFIRPGLRDEWAKAMAPIAEYLSDNFKNRSMGLVCDFAKSINKVYTAVFPTDKILKKIIEDQVKDALLFVHHPSIWDIAKAPEVFQLMNLSLLNKLKTQRIAIYNLHVPLDNFGEYSTSVSLSKALKLKINQPFAPYFGALCGVFATTDCKDTKELKLNFEEIVGHQVALYNYGSSEIEEGKVAVVAGGGNNREILEQVAAAKVKNFITGISINNSHSKSAHDFAKELGINIFGGTHYSTEKFACLAMNNYFNKLGLPSEFLEGEPDLNDI